MYLYNLAATNKKSKILCPIQRSSSLKRDAKCCKRELCPKQRSSSAQSYFRADSNNPYIYLLHKTVVLYRSSAGVLCSPTLPKMVHRIALIRHGESLWNLENIFTGWTDVDLTETGKKEAIQVMPERTLLLVRVKRSVPTGKHGNCEPAGRQAIKDTGLQI